MTSEAITNHANKYNLTFCASYQELAQEHYEIEAELDCRGDDYIFDLQETDEDYDFEDVDCADCGLKFFIRPSLYSKDHGKPFPIKCDRCRSGLPPKYEY